MSDRPTSFNALFDPASAARIRRVRVPLLQRDYAQGRPDEGAKRVREGFLAALHAALTGADDQRLCLDFVFGDVTDGVFTPLDGQQRLTTLFLLHWYLAGRCGAVVEDGWTHFTYETRESARAFCEALLSRRVPPTLGAPAAWIKDQPWFLSTWRGDPTVCGMLVMLDAIHARFGDIDASRAWGRLVDPLHPAVSFFVLPIARMGRPDDLYIKMNSRGKPLTEFEGFKARFEQGLGQIDEARGKLFAERIDGAWADVLWDVRRPDDDLIDDEFMRYLHFVAEVRAWQQQGTAQRPGPVGDFVAAQFTGADATLADLDWLFGALDAWCAKPGDASPERPSAGFFGACLALGGHEPGKVAIYGGRGDGDTDLFRGCCQHYGETDGASKRFSLDRTLLLVAAVVHRVEGTAEFPQRLRVLRNLIEASEDLMTPERMPELIADVVGFVRDGDLAGVKRLSARQVAEERAKAALLVAHPAIAQTLRALEDHRLLRGSLGAFGLDAARFDPAVFALRAQAFALLFAESVPRDSLAGALLACGDYTRPSWDGSRFQLVPWRDEVQWRALLRRSEVRDALAALLDGATGQPGTAAERIDAVTDATLAARGTSFDWRYYLARYPAARSGRKGWYDIREPRAGRYMLYMLEGVRMSGWFYDPYLLAVRGELACAAVAVTVAPTWNAPYERHCMLLTRSGIELRSKATGFAVSPSRDPAFSAAFAAVCLRFGVVDGVLSVAQVDGIDVEDRVQRCASLVSDLVAEGC